MAYIQYEKTAKEIIKTKLGFNVTKREIILLEGGDDGKYVDYVAFRIHNISRIEYRAKYNVNGWDMQILDTVTDESIYI